MKVKTQRPKGSLCPTLETRLRLEVLGGGAGEHEAAEDETGGRDVMGWEGNLSTVHGHIVLC